MSVYSSSPNDSHLHPYHLSINPNLHLSMYCLLTRPSSLIYISFNITSILLLLPLCSFTLYHGLQEWRQSRSTSSAVTMSHSDSFTYNMVTVELISIFGCILCCCGVYMEDPNIVLVWYFLCSFNWFGTTFFHILTCVERYLAVVHPVTYLSLRRERGTRIRNVTIGCVWLLCLAGMGLVIVDIVFLIVDFLLMALSLTVVSFCSISVLRVLTRPGPGEQGGGRERVGQSKQRAFYTIVTILGVLLLRFASGLAFNALLVLKEFEECVIMACGYMFNLPSSLVLPLLFLHRKGKSVCCRNNHTG